MEETYETAEEKRNRLQKLQENNPFDGWTKDMKLKNILPTFIPRLKLAARESNDLETFQIVNEIRSICFDAVLRSRLYDIAGIENPEDVERNLLLAESRERILQAVPAQEHKGVWSYHDDDCRCAFYGSFCNRNGHCWSCCGSTIDCSTGCTAYVGHAHNSAVSSGTPQKV